MYKNDIIQTKDYLKNINLNDVLYLYKFLKCRLIYLKKELKFYRKFNFNFNSIGYLRNLDIIYNLNNSIVLLKDNLNLIDSILHCFYIYDFWSLFFEPRDFNFEFYKVQSLFSNYDFVFDFKSNLLRNFNKFKREFNNNER